MKEFEEIFNGEGAPYATEIKDAEYERLQTEYSKLLRLIFSRVDDETADLIIKLGEIKEEIENFEDIKCFRLGALNGINIA